MVSIPSAFARSRSRSRSTVRGRSVSMASTNRSVGHSAHSGESALTTRLPMAHTKYKKRVAFKKKPVVKVSRGLKAKIEKVVDKGHAHGLYKEFYYSFVLNVVDNGQTVKDLLPFTTDAITGVHFDPVRVLNAASILWNLKTDTTDIKAPTVAGPGNFSIEGLSILARDLHSRVTIRNNSQRVYICKIYECAPKSVNDAIPSASTYWTQCLTNEGVTAGTNPLANSPQDLYMFPQISKAWNQQFASQVTNVTIEPGQSYVYYMQGPKNFVYDYTKFEVAAAFTNLQKMCRQLFIVAHNDLVGFSDTGVLGGANPGVARLNEADNAVGFRGAGLLVEVENVYKLGMPRKTGFNGAAPAGTATQLAFAHDVHAQRTHPDVALTPTSLPIRVDEENPIQPQAPV